MYLLIYAVNSYLYDISMECKVYMNSSLPPYQYEPRCEKTGLRGFRPGPTQTGEADLRICFRICKSRFSHDAAHIMQSSVVILGI